jgi:hypothetical protein
MMLSGILANDCIRGLLKKGQFMSHKLEGIWQVFAFFTFLDEIANELIVSE